MYLIINEKYLRFIIMRVSQNCKLSFHIIVHTTIDFENVFCKLGLL